VRNITPISSENLQKNLQTIQQIVNPAVDYELVSRVLEVLLQTLGSRLVLMSDSDEADRLTIVFREMLNDIRAEEGSASMTPPAATKQVRS
jgi:hypothetical protein